MDLFFILLILVGGLTLLVLELVAIPGTTIAGLSGIGLIGWGVYSVFVEYGTTWGVVSLLISLLIGVLLLIFSLKSRTWKRFSLDKSIDSKVNEASNEDFNVGDRGISITRLASAGIAEIKGQRIEVFTTTSFVDPNTDIEIERIEGTKILVKPISKI